MPPQQRHSPEVHQLIQEACNTLNSQEKPKIKQVLQEIKNCTGHDLPYDTVRRRFLGISLSPSEALLTHVNNFSHLLLRRSLLTGSFFSWTPLTHSLNDQSGRKLRLSVGGSPVKHGSGGFLDDIRRLHSEDHLALIPNMPKLSTEL
jgi:hypothetical protein